MDEENCPEGLSSKRPFLCRVNDDCTLTGHINDDGNAEWDWSRVNAFLKFQTAKEGISLRRCMEEFKGEFVQAQLSFEEFHYRGKSAGRGETSRHTLESRALMVVVCLMCLRRQTPVLAKQMALTLLGILLHRCMVGSHNFDVPLPAGDRQIVFQDGVTAGLADWLPFYGPGAGKWKHLTMKAWCQNKITSSMEHATAFDLLLWLLHLKSCSSTCNAWSAVGQYIWPKLLFILGQALDVYALGLAGRKLEPAPLLKSKRGNSKRVPWMNKICLLAKVGKRRSHRSIIMQSHSDTVPQHADLVQKEAQLEVAEYLKLIKNVFSKCHRFQISWDPSNYSGDEVMILTVWSGDCQKACYLPLQYMMPVDLAKETDVDFQALAQRKQITRITGFAELRAVSHALSAIGKELSVFEIPGPVLYKPLKMTEQRVFKEGGFWICDSSTGEERQQIPDNWSFATQPSLVSISDQGGINRGVLDYAQHMLPLALLISFDGQHRCYNDLKHSLRQSGLYRSFLGFAVVFNVGYGPAGTKTWFHKKKKALDEFCASSSPHCAPFTEYMGDICKERLQLEDGSPEQQLQMWNAMLLGSIQ